MSVTLAQLAESIGAQLVLTDPIEVTGVTVRAQDAAPGDLFAAVQGLHVHGARFAS
ncbi:MAG: UDP-N-acetylmuramoyl-L-alanyl-D-glutamate--2,6-diaminopimelate ligase, partial [Mycobacteriaceae bacterium]|nr:UDP-N-acetylmuramoyl-L-alanyl-D-glutamate--2,6-diaminopimelate ligase [Mycobacteriaceae bacterium]